MSEWRRSTTFDCAPVHARLGSKSGFAFNCCISFGNLQLPCHGNNVPIALTGGLSGTGMVSNCNYSPTGQTTPAPTSDLGPHSLSQGDTLFAFHFARNNINDGGGAIGSTGPIVPGTGRKACKHGMLCPITLLPTNNITPKQIWGLITFHVCWAQFIISLFV